MRRAFLLTGLLSLAACAAPSPPPADGGASSSASAATSSVGSSAGPLATRTVQVNGALLRVPENVDVAVMARDLPGARVLVQDGMGNFWVSQPGQGTVTQLEMQGWTVLAQHAVFRGLDRPHGLAVDPGQGMTLYIAEERRIRRVPLYSDGPLETIYELPAGGRHFTRTLGFGHDGRLYVSIGSTCDVCVEADERHGAILSMNADGSDATIVARGLRNAVFFTWSYVDSRLWATEMGRDRIGDDLPPDELNVIEEGKHYGWPYCYGKRVRDTSFEPNAAFDCAATEPAAVELPAHVAPLGLAMVPEEGWPGEWWYDLLVAEHGSWNRSTPAGYKIVRVPLDAQGRPEGPVEDFIDGWFAGGAALGRPVDLLIRPGGLLYVTDDKAGVIYRVTLNTEP